MKNRYEEYKSFRDNIPIILNRNIKRTRLLQSSEANWHENLEIQFCQSGEGEVLINGELYCLSVDDIIVVNSGLVHYTGTKSELEYSCIIISLDFCINSGFDIGVLRAAPCIRNVELRALLSRISELYISEQPFKAAKLQCLILELLLSLFERHGEKSELNIRASSNEYIKNAINYIKAHYQEKITLDSLADAIYMNKFVLSRNFKKTLGVTVFEYINSYRCTEAASLIARGMSVSFSAEASGFENMSFFAKIFKRYMGILPSEYKRKNKQIMLL